MIENTSVPFPPRSRGVFLSRSIFEMVKQGTCLHCKKYFKVCSWFVHNWRASARYTIGVSKSYPFSQADNLFSLILSPFLKLFSFASTRTPCFLPPGNRAFLLIYRQTAVWTISRFLCRSFTAYSNFVHTFGIKRQYTVLVSEGEPQIPHWRHPIFSFLFFPFFNLCY